VKPQMLLVLLRVEQQMLLVLPLVELQIPLAELAVCFDMLGVGSK